MTVVKILAGLVLEAIGVALAVVTIPIGGPIWWALFALTGLEPGTHNHPRMAPMRHFVYAVRRELSR